MATAAYITLANSDSSLSKRFRVVMGSLQKIRHKAQNRRRTITGKSDNQTGATFWAFSMTLRVHTVDPLGALYGTITDLETFFNLSNPNVAPSNILTFTDHLGVSFTVELIGELNEDNLTPILDGNDAAYLLAIALEEVN